MPLDEILKFIAKKIVQIVFYSSTVLLSMIVILTIIGLLLFNTSGTKGISTVELEYIGKYSLYFFLISALTYLLMKKAMKNW